MALSGIASMFPSAGGPSAGTTGSNSPKTIDEVLAKVESSVGPEQINHTLRTFGNKDTRESILAGKLQSGEDPLYMLHPESPTYTLTCLYILNARLNVPGAQPPQHAVVETFCKIFDPEQARLAPDRVTSLARGIVRASGDNLKHALGPLYDLTTRYPPTLSHLTNLHQIFLNACVVTRHFKAALPVLAVPILHIDSTIADLTYNDNLVYHYAGGVALGALKRWKEAEEFFEIVVTAPAQVPAAIQLEALKKLSLVQLILYGKVNPPPKYTNAALVRQIKNSHYYTFAKAYPQTTAALQILANKEVEIFRNDRNWSLLQQVIAKAPCWLIKKLTLTYLTLSLRDVATQIGVDSEEEVRAMLVRMVESDEINASIAVDGTVTFADSTPQYSKSDVDKALAAAQAQSKLLLEVERKMNQSKEYIAKALKHKDDAWGAPEDDSVYNSHTGAWDDY